MAINMKSCRLCLVVVLLATSCGIQAQVSNKGFVIFLDHSNFTQIVSKHDFIVVAFSAPWCDPCKSLVPEYEKAAAELSRNDPPIILSEIDASNVAHEYLAVQYNIRNIPTLKIMRDNGKIVHNYKGPREAAGIVQYLKKQLGPPSTEIKSKKDISNAVDEKQIFIAGVFPKFSGEEYESFIKVAEKLRSEYNFGHLLDASVERPFIRLLKPFDDPITDFKNFDIDAIEKFIEEEDAPSVVVFDMNPTNVHLEKMFSSDNTKVMMLLNFSSESTAPLKSKFNDIAYLLKGGNLSFLIGDLEPSKPLFEHYKLDESQAPLIFITTRGDEKKYLKTNVEADEVVTWVKKVLDGKAVEFKLSQPIPKENNKPVKAVVLDSLKDMVLNSGKEVLLEFYAPWCVHCQKLAPILDEVAVAYENDPNVLIAKFDVTANDVPSEIFDVKGFPTMFFISGNKEVIKYDNANREKQDFINFIEEHRSDKNTKIEHGVNNKVASDEL